LKSGQAGMVLQKLVNYQIKTAAVLSRDQIRGKFGEFVAETNRGHHFRVFFDRQEAESWLLCD
jgi:PadR family transcriptional regulator AphA